MKKVIAVLILLFCSPSFASFAAEQENGPPQPHEILGHWKMVTLPAALKPMNKVNPWPLPHQYFAFYDDGVMITIMSSQEETPTAKDFDGVKSIFSGKNPLYSWRKNFIVVTQPDIKNYVEIWGMNIFRTAEPNLPFGEGDLLMTLAGGEDGNPVYYRWLTRIE